MPKQSKCTGLAGILVNALPDTCETCPMEAFRAEDESLCFPLHKSTTQTRLEKRLDGCPLKVKDDYDIKIAKFTFDTLKVLAQIDAALTEVTEQQERND